MPRSGPKGALAQWGCPDRALTHPPNPRLHAHVTLQRELAATALVLGMIYSPAVFAQDEPRVLVFSETAGFRHDSIEAGIGLVQELGEQHGFGVDATEDSSVFRAGDLDHYATVVWLNTTGDVLDDEEQQGFQRYIEAGGGYVGVHSAADTEYEWPFYGELLGGEAWFRSHPAIQEAELVVDDGVHPSSAHLPARFAFTDEWYNFRDNPRPAVNVLLTLDEDSYDPGVDGMGDHPIAWFHEPSGGRAWYTGLGHRRETYSDGAFRLHLLGGILWTGRLATSPRVDAPCTGDADGDGTVRIDELVDAVRNSLQGCPPPKP